MDDSNETSNKHRTNSETENTRTDIKNFKDDVKIEMSDTHVHFIVDHDKTDADLEINKLIFHDNRQMSILERSVVKPNVSFSHELDSLEMKPTTSQLSNDTYKQGEVCFNPLNVCHMDTTVDKPLLGQDLIELDLKAANGESENISREAVMPRFEVKPSLLETLKDTKNQEKQKEQSTTDKNIETNTFRNSQPFEISMDKSEKDASSTIPKFVEIFEDDQTQKKIEKDLNHDPKVKSIKKTPVTKYIIKRTIGQGNFCKVKLGKHAFTDKYVAVKIVETKSLSDSMKARVKKEMNAMKTLRHPNIIKLYEIIEKKEYVYLVMEYASGGELFDFIIHHGSMREKDAKRKFMDICSAVDYMHQQKIVHRDLKAENILLNRKLDVRIADFGFATDFSEKQLLRTFCGSPPYAAPELLAGKPYIGPPVDLWSLGIVLFVLVSGRLPFLGGSLHELLANIKILRYEMPYFLSNDCQDLIKRFFVVDPKLRISMEQVMSHKWLKLKNDKKKTGEENTEIEINEYKVNTIMKQGYSRKMIESSLHNKKFDDICATYYLLDTPEEMKARILEEKFHLTRVEEVGTKSQTVVNGIITEAQRKDLEKDLNSQTINGSVGSSVGKALKKWMILNKNETGHTEYSEYDSINPAFMDPEFQAQLASLLPNDPNMSLRTNPDQKNLIQSLNQFSHTNKTGKAGIFQPQKLGTNTTSTSKNTEKPASINHPTPVLLKPAQTTTKLSKPNQRVSKEPPSISKNKPMPTIPDEDSKKKSNHFLKNMFKTKKHSDSDSGSVKGRNEGSVKSTSKPRVDRFAVSLKTVSSKSADEIMHQIIMSLDKYKVKYEYLDKYLLLCNDGNIQWEFEVCRVGIRNMNGIRMKRIFGDSFTYGRKMQRFMDEWKL